MEWEIIKPARGSAPRPNVSISLRKTSAKGRPKMVITIGKAVLAEVGWPKGSRLELGRVRPLGLVRIALGADDDHKGSWSSAVLAVSLEPSAPDAELRPAEAVQWRLENGAVIVTLPDWAAPERQALQAAQAAADAARSRLAPIAPRRASIMDHPDPAAQLRANAGRRPAP